MLRINRFLQDKGEHNGAIKVCMWFTFMVDHKVPCKPLCKAPTEACRGCLMSFSPKSHFAEDLISKLIKYTEATLA